MEVGTKWSLCPVCIGEVVGTVVTLHHRRHLTQPRCGSFSGMVNILLIVLWLYSVESWLPVFVCSVGEF